MDPDFEDEYADELEALQDLDDDIEPYATKSRKSLDFSTPSCRRKGRNLDDSIYTPLESPASDKDKQSNKFNGLRNEAPKASKNNNNLNKRKGMWTDLSEDEDELSLKIDEPDIAPVPKRQRMSPQPKSETIRDYVHRITDKYDLDRPRVLRRIPAGRFVPCTSTEGSRVYMSMKGHEFLKRQMEDSISTGQKSLQLLGTPLAVLKAQVEEEKHRKQMEEAQELLDRAQRIDNRREDEDSSDEASDEGKPALWVERYAPRRYTELLSDESTNRLLLRWLKQWDYVVFKKEKKEAKSDKAKKKQQQAQQKGQQGGKDGKFFKSNQPELTEELDDHSRPMFKVALLSGPPGLGKTTLAHVIARHAGYNVVEINASDDRSAELFKTKIEAATQMKAVLGADPRPNCLVIDEIDGAPAPAINMLIQMIKGPQESAGKRKKQGSLLLRPIICICNDVYVPSLRQLRHLALSVSFPPTISSKLASRLSEISKKEQLKADMTSLLALCEKADNDIRSCLNTLQFIKGKLREVSLYSIQSLSLGQKDAHKSLFSVWQSIFKMPKPLRKRYVNPFERGTLQEVEQLQLAMKQNNTSDTARFQNVLDVAQASGEHEKIMQGLYENYLESKAKDPRMEGIQKACEWMCFADGIHQFTATTQNYSLMGYLPYLPVTFHLYFASNSHPRIQYPSSQFEMRTKTNKTENLISTLMSDVAPTVKKNLNLTITVTEFLSPLTDIIQPSLRPVNTQLYSAREKAELNHLIHVMIAYNMTYHQERTPEGQYTYTLDPNIDEVVRFPGIKAQKQQLTYAAKQLIAREIDMEKMRKAEMASSKYEPEPAPKPSTSGPANKELPNHLRQTLTPKAIKPTEDQWTPQKPAVDFFGRVITKTAEKVVKKKEEKKEIIGGDIWFRFKEGFTNAVRKTVRVSDLL